MVRRRWILDTETTGLDADVHEVWEAALLDPDSGEEHLWRIKPSLAVFDEKALEIGGFYDRTRRMKDGGLRVVDLAGRDLSRPQPWTSARLLAPQLARLLARASVICAVPTFDRPFILALLKAHQEALTCHHRMRDIGSMAYGYLHGTGLAGGETGGTDFGTDDFAKLLGVDPAQFERHSALGDCRLVAAMLKVIEGAP